MPCRGCEGVRRRWGKHVYAGARRGIGDPSRSVARGRARPAGSRSRTPRDRGGLGRPDAPPRGLVRPARPHGPPRRGPRGRALRDRAAAGGRPDRATDGRDDPRPVRVHRSGDHRAGRVRQGPPHRARRAGARGGDRSARRTRRVVRRLHQPHRPRDPGAPGRRPPSDRALQRRDLAPTAAGGSLRRRTRPGRPRPRRAEPPHVGAGRHRGREGPDGGHPRGPRLVPRRG